MQTLILTPELDKIRLPNWITKTDYNTFQMIEIKSLISNEVWVTAKKIKLRVVDMETSHIQNCINCFNGVGKSQIPESYLGGKEKWLKIFTSELLKRQ